MEWAVWLVILFLVIFLVIESILTLDFYINYTDCANNVSPYCPEYTCPTTGIASGNAGASSVSYSDCVSNGDCIPNLIPPCSLAATSSSSSSS